MSPTAQTILVTGGTGCIGSHTVVLFEEMGKANVKTLVFSSSAIVYGDPDVVQYIEGLPLNGITKHQVNNSTKTAQ